MVIPKVAIILLHWNEKELTRLCLQSINQSRYPRVLVIVVDNGSTDGSGRELAKEFPGVVFLKLDRNRGFCGGKNVGIRYAQDQDADFLFILDNDTVIHEDCIHQLVTVCAQNPGVGMVCPKTYYCERPNTIYFAGGDLNVETGWPIPRGAGQIDSGQWDQVAECTFITGCAMFVTRDCMDRLKGFDEDFFLTFEDTDLSARAIEFGYKLMYVPPAKMWHKVGGSTSGPYSAYKMYYMERNRLLFIRKRKLGWKKLLFLHKRMFYYVLTIRGLALSGDMKAFLAAFKGIVDYFRGCWGEGHPPALIRR